MSISVSKTISVVSKQSGFESHAPWDQLKTPEGIFGYGEQLIEHGSDWFRPMNATSSSDVWRALYYLGISKHKKKSCSVVVGAPYDLCNEQFKAGIPTGAIELSTPDATHKLNINQVLLIPECAAHALAFATEIEETVIVISIGFGTVEVAGATSEGQIIKGSQKSITCGMHQCVEPFRAALKERGFDRGKLKDNQLHYWDEILRDAFSPNPKKILRVTNTRGEIEILSPEEIREIGTPILHNQARSISENVKQYLMERSYRYKVIVAGGGTGFSIIRDDFCDFLEAAKFDPIVSSEQTSVLSAAKGYREIAQQQFGDQGIGIDIGNYSTITLH